MDAAFPVVTFDTPVEKLGILINKENGAALAKDESGNYHIVTKYDVLQAWLKQQELLTKGNFIQRL
jgi:cystathionine beta-synthase